MNIPSLHEASVLVIGDVMLDRYWHGATSRISPEAPVPVVHVKQREERLGGAANVALNIAMLGASVGLIGVTGHDEAADILQRKLDEAGVECLLERLSGYSTITKLRVLSRHQQLIRLDFEDGFHAVDPAPIVERLRDNIADAKIIVLSDYGKGTLQISQELIAIARQHGKTVLVDPKNKDFSVYAGASIITPNWAEFEAVVGPCENDAEIVRKGLPLLRKYQLGALLITRGEHGMTLLREGDEPVHLATQAREVYDVTGAGDTVISVLAAALGAGQDLVAAMELANLAAGIVVGKLGTAAVTVPELRRALREREEIYNGVMTEEQLLIAVEDARAHGETIVMTNGCFDILHAGHVHYLNQARKLGNRLIVAVNSDASVSRLKGPERPINPLEMRMAVLAGLQSVDWVVPFGEDTPERLICRLLPDVLVKGGDYAPHQVAGGECVTAHGGKVVILDFKEGCSTSGIIAAIREWQRP